MSDDRFPADKPFPFLVYGVAMEPTFHNRQTVQVDPTAYRNPSSERGDIVAFWLVAGGRPDMPSCARVLGLPGETVEVMDGDVYINQTL